MNKAKAEWARLRSVLVHEPGIEMFFGLLEPISSLYERAFNEELAIKEHQGLVHVLESDFGVKVHFLKSILLKNEQMVNELIEKAKPTQKFDGDEKAKKEAKNFVYSSMGIYHPEHLLKIMMVRPTITLKKKNKRIVPFIELRTPLSNLFFMRDQQILTDKGFVIGRPKLYQRRGEEQITKMSLKTLGATIRKEIKKPGTLEGGDFIPAGKMAFIGKGDRTNDDAINQLKKAVGFDELVVVDRPIHPLIGRNDSMITMHLDTYFNLLGNGIAVGNKDLLRNAKVTIFEKASTGNYIKQKMRGKTSLYDYLMINKFELIEITTFEQICFASNFLCISDKKFVSVDVRTTAPDILANLSKKAEFDPNYRELNEVAHKEYHKLRLAGEFFPRKKNLLEMNPDFLTIRFDRLTGGWGAIHCVTCPLNRG